jgi:hypothetical protein
MIAAELLLFSSSIQGVQIVSCLQGVYNWSIIPMLFVWSFLTYAISATLLAPGFTEETFL